MIIYKLKLFLYSNQNEFAKKFISQKYTLTFYMLKIRCNIHYAIVNHKTTVPIYIPAIAYESNENNLKKEHRCIFYKRENCALKGKKLPES